ncbi:MAG: hypothetical protein AAF846_11720 [Chloroflexota bacterium]
MSKGTILYVEPNLGRRELFGFQMRYEGYDIHVVSTGEEAITVLEEFLPDGIILPDRLLNSDFTGFNLARKIQSNEETRNIPILFFLQSNEISDRLIALELGVDYCDVGMPLIPQELSLRIENLLRCTNKNNPSS